MGGNNRQQMGPLYRTKRIQDTIHQNSSFVICSDQNESILLPVSQRRDRKPSQQTGSGKSTESGNSRLLFPDIPCAKKERKVSFNIRPVFIKPLHRETSIQNGNSQIGKTSDETQRLGCLHRFNRCIPTRADTSSIQEVSSLRTRRSSISLFGPTVRNVPKSVNFLETDGRYCSFSTPTCHISAAADLVLLGSLHLHPLQMCLLSVRKPHILPLDHPISINGMIRSHLQWWINPIRFETGTSIHPPDPEFFLYMDARHYGWGAHLEPTTLSFHGHWTENQSQLHINMLEMMAIRLALKQAKTFIHHSCIMISTDNTTVVSDINKQGGTHSPNLCVEVWKILNWCLEQDIVIRVRHIPGKFNILADRLSRLDKPIKTEWALDQTVANSVLQMLNFPNVDLFATRFNHRLPLYVSPVQDYKALAIDALFMDWNHLHAYAFPPFILIPAVLEKIRQHQCRIVLIAPFWPQQQWFSELLLLLVSAPICLPLIPRLLTQSKGRFVHQNLPILDLHIWELSNNQSEIRNFHKTLQILSPDQEEHLHKKSTMQNGPSSLIESSVKSPDQ